MPVVEPVRQNQVSPIAAAIPKAVPSEIVLLADRADWAFHRICKRIAAMMPERNFRIALHTDRLDYLGKTVIFWWDAYRRIRCNEAESAVCFYDGITWTEADVRELARRFKLLLAANITIRDRLIAITGDASKVRCVQDGVDCATFYPAPKRPNEKKLQVGWAGNSNLAIFNHVNIKRIDIIRKVTERTRDIADWHFLDRDTNGIPFESMPDWYRSLDIITCASMAEGTPNPILEGAACGLLPVTTRVGVTPEMQAHGACIEFVDLTVDSFVEALWQIYEHKEILDRARNENPAVMRERWDWGKRIQAWRGVFDVLDGAKSAPQAPPAPGPSKETPKPLIKPVVKPPEVKQPEVKPPPAIPAGSVLKGFNAAWDMGSPFYLIADSPDWAFDRICDRILDAYGTTYNISRCYHGEIEKHGCVVKCPRGIVFWWGAAEVAVRNLSRSLVCFYDELSWTDDVITRLSAKVSGFCAVNPNIMKRIKDNEVVKAKGLPVFYVPDGVDTTLFHPADKRPDLPRLQIGWLGNSTMHLGKTNDVKGFGILEELQRRTEAIADWHMHDREKNPIPHAQTPGFFRRMNIVICCSEAEGTPNPVMEGLACGCLAITTPVGLTEQIARNGAKIIFCERTADAFEKAIIEVHENHSLLDDAFTVNPAVMREKWDWALKVRHWEDPVRLIAEEKKAAVVRHDVFSKGQLDLSDTVTVVTTSVGSDGYAECLRRLSLQDCRFNLVEIKYHSPMDVAFQAAMDACDTPYYVQIDEDMWLESNAVRTLYEGILKQGDKCAIYSQLIRDAFSGTKVVGIKIFKRNIVKDYPYLQKDFSCEVSQVQRLQDAGYTIIVNDNPKPIASVNEVWSEWDAFERMSRDFEKVRQRPDLHGSRTTYLKIFLDKFKGSGDRSFLMALAGAFLGMARDESDGEKSFREPEFRKDFNRIRQVLRGYVPLRG